MFTRSVFHEELEKKLLEQVNEKVQATEEQLRQEMIQKVCGMVHVNELENMHTCTCTSMYMCAEHWIMHYPTCA